MLKRLPVVAGLLLLAASARAQAPAASDNWDARLSDFKGDVQVFAPGEQDGLPAEKGMPLDEGDRIVTAQDASADLSLDGGSVIHLTGLSDFTLTDTKRSQTAFKLSFGTFLAKVQKLLQTQSMVVEGPTAVAAVRGTEFGVEAPKDAPDETHVGVFDEGKVEVKGQSGATETLIGGQETKVARGQAPLHAYQLQRLAKHRAFMRATMRRRLSTLRAAWRASDPAKRRALRAQFVARAIARRQKLKQLLQDKQKTRQKEQRGEERAKRNREKMEELKQRIREHRQ